jgi:hypothetical protein
MATKSARTPILTSRVSESHLEKKVAETSQETGRRAPKDIRDTAFSAPGTSGRGETAPVAQRNLFH